MAKQPQPKAVLQDPIKIVTVEPILIKPATRGYAFLIVRIRTDGGIDGLGPRFLLFSGGFRENRSGYGGNRILRVPS